MGTNLLLLWTAIIAFAEAAMFPNTHFGRNNLQNSYYQNDHAAVQDRPKGDDKGQGVIQSENPVRSSVESYRPVPAENYGTNAPVDNTFVRRTEQVVASVAPIEYVNYKNPEYVDYSSYLYPLYPATYYRDYY